ncbi:deoxyribose-phosphate aldolase [Alkalihalophilus lindianensis]|uniref:Deoxyribose-phosphate aldolase n=1 Tax=Alkalihalophilus lindianensis TaxID=1630542 RepID=A0ABU3X986_9BACI|nr:deoxyribose-phosphate aldolase [Alkalihalophilus lindianensis]MDV2684435.1 deoxyribose-phosphate aldolase [Alkalihalophilus lindianensis]
MTNLASYIDHTLLKPEATQSDIELLCDEAVKYRFATVCIHPSWITIAKKRLGESSVGITTVIGFPLGMTTTSTKVNETIDSIKLGATEVDMVINIGELKSNNHSLVKGDIEKVVEAAKGVPVKVIIETGMLTDEEKRVACKLAVEAGAQFVKTSTGFGPGYATVSDIELMKNIVGDQAEVKASGGVRDQETALTMIKAGATRIGTSSGKEILQGTTSKTTY